MFQKSIILAFCLLLLSVVMFSVGVRDGVEAAALVPLDGNAIAADPGEPGWISFYWEDTISKKGGALLGDSFGRNVFERPYSAEEMVYHPELDIIRTEVTSDATYIYFTVRLNGSNVEMGGLTGWYGIELDMDMDGTGDFLIWSDGGATSEWNTDGLFLYKDRNNDVGGKLPLLMEEGRRPEDSFEMVLAPSEDENADVLVWKRRDPDDVYSMEFALKKSAIEYDGMFLWSAWANNDADGHLKMDYNDLMNLASAGSPYVGNVDYPLKGVALLDNTCRMPFGFNPTGAEPGVCYGVSPTAVPASPNHEVNTPSTPGPVPTPDKSCPPGYYYSDVVGGCVLFI